MKAKVLYRDADKLLKDAHLAYWKRKLQQTLISFPY